ncbi:Nucleotide-binding, alpha-beta plait [Cynara cardunculus var. scolymus]|uniref:Nucleotide-binding, alpha-beta plait n=1 Tax=Cynara cardunculus var. scolymus TaxID=59895 RepID=A0A118JT57_CYNCS|nr:Nucleotide-binding, alpha-beta plait [Cynara cardunculus var. scolymus]
MATYCLTSSLHSCSCSSSPPACKSKINSTDSLISLIRFPRRNEISSFTSPLSSSSSSFILCPKKPATCREDFTVSALVEDEKQQYSSGSPISGNGYSLQEDFEFRNSFKPFELYVCNLPRSCGIPELLNQFETYGTVQSVEVPRNVETGISRGCGYVTMSSLNEAKAAIAALDGSVSFRNIYLSCATSFLNKLHPRNANLLQSPETAFACVSSQFFIKLSDVDGREMRVRFAADMNSKWGSAVTSSRPQKNLVFESPYKVYAGNLAWSVKPEDLRNHFSQFGTVVSTTVLHDRKGGKNREFYGRTLKLREVINWPQSEPEPEPEPES